jgi:hypothetical protein
VTAGLLTIVLGLSLLPFQFVRDFQKHISAWIAGLMPVPIDLPDPSSYSWKHKAGGTVLGVAAMTAAALIGVKYIQAGLFLLAAGWGACKLYSALYWLFARKAAAAINTRVTGTEAFLDTRVSSGPTPPDAPSTAGSPASSQRSLRQPLPVGLEMVTAETLPPVSEESSRKLESIGLRGPSVRRAYRKGILILSASTVVLAIIYWLTGSSPFNFKVPSNPQGWRLPERMPAFLFVLFLITLVMLSRRGAAWFRGVVVSNLLSAMTGAEVSSPPLAIEEGGASIRPIGLPFLGGLWVLLILTLTPSRYASLEVPQGLLFAGASLGVLFGYLYWIWKRTKALEHQYPYQPPFNLLALRVFGSPHLSDFLDLTSSWQWIGTRQMLDGPDTVGHKARDLINYFSGRPGDSIVEDTAKLHEALREFRTKPDRQLRFPVNSMQCSNASWKEALQTLLDAADVVVMDLSSLSEKNRGIAYELGKVLDRIALRRIVFLVDDSTDLELLKQIVAHEWEDMSPDSPNRGVGERTLRLYHVGGPLKHTPDESLYDWRRRLRAQIDEKGLVCLLYDAAQPRRNAAAVDAKSDAQSIRWSRVAMPQWIRFVRNFAFGTLLFLVLLITTCRLMTGR